MTDSIRSENSRPFIVGGAFGDIRQWEACTQPERTPDEWVQFVLGCKGCDIAIRAATTIEPKPGDFRGWWKTRTSALTVWDQRHQGGTDVR